MRMKYVRYICCIIAAVFLFLSVCMPVSAVQGVSTVAGPVSGTGTGTGTGYGGQSGGPENASLQDPVMVRDQDRVRAEDCKTDEACNATRLRALVTERNQVYATGAGGSLPPQQVAERAAYAFRAAAPLTGGSGPGLIRLSEEVNVSVRSVLQNEEQIRSRNGFMVFLFGGDLASADVIMQHVVQNRVRTEEMNRLINGCGCDPETVAILREQVQAMEQEQTRF